MVFGVWSLAFGNNKPATLRLKSKKNKTRFAVHDHRTFSLRVLRVESPVINLRKGASRMPERRGVQATEDVKAEWSQAYKIYLKAPGDRYDKKKDRTSRIDFVAQEMNLTRKQAKRRIRNYEAWQRNIKKGLVNP